MLRIAHAALQMVVFSGGDDAALVKFLAETTGQNVAIVYDEDRVWPAWTIRDDLGSPLEAIKKAGKVSIREARGAKAIGVDIPYWPHYVAFDGFVGPAKLTSWVPAPTNTRIGRFEIPQGKHVSIAGLRRMLKAPIDASWFFENVPLIVSSNSWSAEDVLRPVELALGAQTSLQSGSWRIFPDFDVLRSRMIGLGRSAPAKPDAPTESEASLRYTSEAYRYLTAKQVERLYQKSSNLIEIKLPERSTAALWAEVRMNLKFPKNSDDPSVQSMRAWIERDIDWGKGFGLFLGPKKMAATFLLFSESRGPKGAGKWVF